MIYKCIIVVSFIILLRRGENHLIFWSRVLRSVCTGCRSLIIGARGAGPETLTWPKEIAEPVWGARAGHQGQGRYLSDKLGPGTAMLDIMAGQFINFYPVTAGITSYPSLEDYQHTRRLLASDFRPPARRRLWRLCDAKFPGSQAIILGPKVSVSAWDNDMCHYN